MLKTRLLEVTYKSMLILSAFCLQYLLLGEGGSPIVLFIVLCVAYGISAVSEHHYMKSFEYRVIEKYQTTNFKEKK